MRLRFLDRLLALEPRASAAARKCVSFEEAMLVRPGLGRGVPPTLLVEWLGQLSAVLVAESTDYTRLPVLGSFASCAFGGRALAGDACRIELRVRSWHEDCAFIDGEISIEGGDALLSIERAVLAFLPLSSLWDEAELRAAVRAARGEFPGPVGLR